jgi:hypothetical protein
MAVNLPACTKYGLNWPAGIHPVQIPLSCIQRGGQWVEDGWKQGAPLFDLYRDVQSILWPDDDHHEWSDLILKTILDERITIVQGSKDSSKTHSMAKYALVDYFAFPRNTLILMSSTDLRGLELRVWGDVKDLYNRAKEVWPEVPGFVLESKYGIFTDGQVEEGQARDIRRGLCCIPVMDSEGKWTGMRRWVGVKQKRRRVLADELQFYPSAYLPTLANLNKGNFKFVGVGNPIGEADPLDKLGEPKVGWDSLPEITETTTWKNTMGGTTIQLLGSDSPAIKHPGQYEYLIDQSDIDYIVNFWGTDTAEYWNQGMGIRRPGINAHRVLTREAARKFGAMDKVTWGAKPPIGIYAIDASYGGDRCAGCRGELGWDINGKQVLAISEPEVIPIRVFPKGTPENQKKLAEDQIAEFVKARCFDSDIPPRNVFHDATGRGSVGTAFARIWSADTNPIEFGVKPTERPVQNDMFIYDHEKRERRLTRCDEHYSKFVTELWFSFAYAVEARQIRTLPNSVLDELCAREWGTVRGGKKEVEAKEFTKKRLGRSPDFADAAVIVLEGARRLGFTINKMEGPKQMRQEDDRWKNALRQRVANTRKSYTLNYAV